MAAPGGDIYICGMSDVRSLEQNKRLAVNISRVLSLYGYITDSYIIEFFTDHLWEALPESWRFVLSDLTAPELADQLLSDSHRTDTSYRSVWPLSLLALKVTAQSLAFQRTPRHDVGSADKKRPAEFQKNHCQSSLLDPLFRKHVKPKKQHEIRRLGKLVKELSDVTKCDHVVDIGSGQGHLSRVLSFGQGLCVTAVEADRNLVTMATKFDHDLIYMLKKERTRPTKSAAYDITSIESTKPPRHVSAHVDPQASWEEFVNQLTDCTENGVSTSGSDTNASLTCTQDLGSPELSNSTAAFGQSVSSLAQQNFSQRNNFILTGLHACGDLSVAMLRHFARCPDVIGITSVACCYMKLTTCEVPQPPGILTSSHPLDSHLQQYGYPVSSWVSRLPGHKLSYKSREVACHAIEDYIDRLQGDSDILRTHCYRAVLETVIRGIDPTMKRAGVQTIKNAHKLPFKEYAQQGLQRIGLDPDTTFHHASVEDMLAQHQKVVAFFSVALLLAPLVETLILLDRMIFLQEQGLHCEVIPLFKPEFSPRNLVLVAAKGVRHLSDILEEISSSYLRSQHIPRRCAEMVITHIPIGAHNLKFKLHYQDVFGVCEETEVPGENPRKHTENNQTPCTCCPLLNSIPGPQSCKAIMLTTDPQSQHRRHLPNPCLL
ncbi:methyltransferase-like protein 25B isoform X2 [Rhinoderma darwinii]|uniref:methyltransferase-like protein 25B isoform X2 n=1 Tax=Rhinoderma darwinii TaxID=43563 RepID=UPI003F67BA5E